jgi:hypothetical protein
MQAGSLQRNKTLKRSFFESGLRKETLAFFERPSLPMRPNLLQPHRIVRKIEREALKLLERNVVLKMDAELNRFRFWLGSIRRTARQRADLRPQ